MIRVSLIGLLILSSVDLVAAEADEIDFAQQIRPILSDKCFACHGPDEHARESDLRLDIRASALEAEAFVPGNPAESELVRRITAKDQDERMPPPSFHKELSEKEIELLTRWISEGAAYQQHWAYRPLQRPQIPNLDHPQIRSADRCVDLGKTATPWPDLFPTRRSDHAVPAVVLGLAGHAADAAGTG